MNYRPTQIQILFHKTAEDTAVSGGWRSGKSMLLAAEVTPHCLIPSPREYLIALIGPTYKEPRAEFDYIVDFLTTVLPKSEFDPERHVSRPKDGPCEFTIPSKKVIRPDGSETRIHFATVRTYTAAEAEAIRSFNADAMVACEMGGLSRESFFNIYGRVASTGGFVIGSGTLEASQKWYHDIIKEGLDGESRMGISSFILPSWANTVVFPMGRQDAKIKRLEKILPAELFAVRIGAEPIRMTGVAVSAANRERHVTGEGTKFNDNYPVELAIDPGYTGGYAVLAIQFYEGKIRIIDEVYVRLLATPEVIDICKSRPWWGSIINGNAGVIDRAAKQHNSSYGDSVLEIWADLADIHLDLTEQNVPVEDGLDQIRIHLNADRIIVNPDCLGTLAEWDLGAFPDGFDQYQPWHYKANGEGNLVGDKALEGADHASTALIYYLVHRFGYITPDTIVYGPEVSWLRHALGADRDDSALNYGSSQRRYMPPQSVVETY
jgi:hypothetical protein